MVCQISYDLASVAPDYDSLYAKLAEFGEVRKILQSTWLISTTTKTIEGMTDELSKLMKKGDRFFISSVQSGCFNGWHSQSTWDWVTKELQK